MPAIAPPPSPLLQSERVNGETQPAPNRHARTDTHNRCASAERSARRGGSVPLALSDVTLIHVVRRLRPSDPLGIWRARTAGRVDSTFENLRPTAAAAGLSARCPVPLSDPFETRPARTAASVRATLRIGRRTRRSAISLRSRATDHCRQRRENCAVRVMRDAIVCDHLDLVGRDG